MDTIKKYGRYCMSCVNELSFRDTSNAVANIGDNIQALAMDYIFEKNNIAKENIILIKRDFINESSKEKFNLLMHSEFTKNNINSRINLNSNIVVKGIFSAVFYDDISTLQEVNPNVLGFLKQNEPIGCRDERSVVELRRYGIESYLMGCFTLCFPKRCQNKNYEKIFFVDTPKDLADFIPQSMKGNIEYLTHSVNINRFPVDELENERIDKYARYMLKKYKNEAKLVVTGRLHVAVPCLAMGIPVILTCDNLDFRFGWIEKFLKPYQHGEYNQIDWNPTTVNLEDVKEVLNRYFSNILQNKSGENELKWLDKFYSNRKRVESYKYFREKLRNFLPQNKNSDFNYVIWGAGHHCKYVYDLVKEMYPFSKLKFVIDRYKRGNFCDVPIINGTELKDDFNYMMITTVPGTNDALEWLQKNKDKSYIFLTSQHKS